MVTGSHLEEGYGNTIDEINLDGIKSIEKVKLGLIKNECLPNTIARSIVKFSESLKNLRPDIILLLGDRYEIFALTIAAYTLNIPVAHIHGGETTLGALDEGFRHSITKMSSLHFTVTEQYKKNVIRMGEDPKTVFNFGAPAVDSINMVPQKKLHELELDLGIELKNQKIAICTYHPETILSVSVEEQINNLVAAFEKRSDLTVIFTMPNSDPGNNIIRNKISEFVKHNKKAIVVESLGFQRYISLLSYAAFMIGNSSSGLTEAPMMGIPTINIGDRQKGRFLPDSVISCSHDESSIISAIKTAEALNIQKISPFGKGGASKKIIEEIIGVNLEKLIKIGSYVN